MHRILQTLCVATALCCLQAEEYVPKLNIVDPETLVPAETRIVGGTPAPISRYPYTVQLAYNDRLMCGGTLLTRRHVLSAAHCLIDWSTMQPHNPNLLSIRAGTSVLNTGGSTARVSLFVIHESYNMVTHDSDVAVLVLQTLVTLGSEVATAAIPTQNSAIAYNTTLVHVGWGTMVSGGSSLSNVLLEVQVQKVNLTVCATRYSYLSNITNIPYEVTSNMICAGRLGVGGADACQGDSGGPLIALHNLNLVVGITSWGYSCGEAQYPGVSARVASFTNWINDVMARYNSAPSLSLTNTAVLLASLLVTMTFKQL